MPEFTLTPEPFLGGYSQDFGGTTLAEVSDISLVSIMPPRGAEAALDAAVEAAWGVAPPAPGETAAGGGVTLFQAAAGQWFAMGGPADGLAVTGVAAALGEAGYYTEQTDNWAALRLSGPLAVAALERICPLDLAAIPAGGMARTVMEHLGVIMLREAEDRFLLLCISSAAGSFLHALETSVKNVA